jgi:hypothetical protein
MSLGNHDVEDRCLVESRTEAFKHSRKGGAWAAVLEYLCHEAGWRENSTGATYVAPGQAACALSRMPNAPTIFITVSKLGLPFGESAL